MSAAAAGLRHSSATVPGRWRSIAALAVSGTLFVAGWLVPAAPRIAGSGPPWDSAFVGYAFGTMYGQMSLAAAWFALGPLLFPWRALLTMGLLGAVSLAVGFAVSYGPEAVGPNATMVLVVLFIQWICTQLPFWILVAFHRVQVCSLSTAPNESDFEGQLGIRQFGILTVLCAVFLGSLWLLFALANGQSGELGWKGGLIGAIFIATVDAIIMGPLTIAVLLVRRAVLAVMVAIGFATLVAWLEIPVIAHFPFGLRDSETLWSIHLFRGAWVLGILLLLRAGGYRLLRQNFLPAGNLCQAAKVSLATGR